MSKIYSIGQDINSILSFFDNSVQSSIIGKFLLTGDCNVIRWLNTFLRSASPIVVRSACEKSGLKISIPKVMRSYLQNVSHITIDRVMPKHLSFGSKKVSGPVVKPTISSKMRLNRVLKNLPNSLAITTIMVSNQEKATIPIEEFVHWVDLSPRMSSNCLSHFVNLVSLKIPIVVRKPSERILLQHLAYLKHLVIELKFNLKKRASKRTRSEVSHFGSFATGHLRRANAQCFFANSNNLRLPLGLIDFSCKKVIISGDVLPYLPSSLRSLKIFAFDVDNFDSDKITCANSLLAISLHSDMPIHTKLLRSFRSLTTLKTKGVLCLEMSFGDASGTTAIPSAVTVLKCKNIFAGCDVLDKNILPPLIQILEFTSLRKRLDKSLYHNGIFDSSKMNYLTTVNVSVPFKSSVSDVWDVFGATRTVKKMSLSMQKWDFKSCVTNGQLKIVESINAIASLEELSLNLAMNDCTLPFGQEENDDPCFFNVDITHRDLNYREFSKLKSLRIEIARISAFDYLVLSCDNGKSRVDLNLHHSMPQLEILTVKSDILTVTTTIVDVNFHHRYQYCDGENLPSLLKIIRP